MTIILGIDPGSRLTGYGVIKMAQRQAYYVDSGTLRVASEHFSKRLGHIFAGITEIITQYQPTEAAIEQVFMHQNANSALKLGQARGAAIAAISHLSIHEYSARQVKKAVTGYGAADKQQIQQMVKTLLGLSTKPQSDAADALAIALCHAYTQRIFTVNNG